MTPHFLKLAKYRLDFLRHSLRSFGIANTCRLFKLLRKSDSGKGKLVRIPSSIVGRSLSLRSGTSDIDAFYKIFVWKEYQIPADSLPNRIKTIIDLGSNVGLSIIYFACQFPDARIIGLEPDLTNFELLSRNTNGISHLSLVMGGIWKKRCSLFIENPDARPDSYQLVECDSNKPGSISAFSMPDLIEIHQLQEIDILKVDIEGSEIQLFLEGYEAWLPKVHTLVIELHGAVIRSELTPKILRYFRRHFIQGENDVFVR